MARVGGTRSMFGDQPSSRRPSSPNYGFGTGTRANQEKVFVSQEHARAAAQPFSPGPASYNLLAAVGPQVDGSKPSSPRYGFGSQDRWTPKNRKEVRPGPGTYEFAVANGDQVSSRSPTSPRFGFGSSTRAGMAKVFISQDHNKDLFGINSPGPQTNTTLTDAIGPQILSRNVGQPAWVMGKAERFTAERSTAANSPGPGTYEPNSAIGAQVSSAKPSTPKYGFGTSNRRHQEKVYLGQEFEKTAGGRDAPGPGAYDSPRMTGARVASSRSFSASSWGFGTSSRFNKGENTSFAPGPGTYVV